MEDEISVPDSLDASAQQELDEIKNIVTRFTNKLTDKFHDYILTVSLLPPSKDEDDEKNINVLILVDDAESEKLTNQELREKLERVMNKVADEVSDRLKLDIRLISDVWQDCYDGNHEEVQRVIQSAPIHDSGMLSALKVTDVHKKMVLERFEKYIVTYVLAGSLVKGKATKKSDIDVFIVIDDTDVKKMSRAELKDKLRAIIVGMASEASQAVGVKNKLNIQVYILTDFWDNIKQANPIIFTFLRDGIPLYDRGIFMAWKQLLQMGRIKPSPEAIDMFMNTGSQALKKVDKKLKEIAMEDFFWATVTSSQAAIMLYGLPPPTPKETPEVMHDIFVEKEGFLDESDIETIREVNQVRKDLEHGDKKSVKGEEIDHLVDITQAFIEKSKNLFEKIQGLKNEERFDNMVEDVESSIKVVLHTEGKEADDFDSYKDALEEELVNPGKLPQSILRDVEDIKKAKERYEDDSLPKAEINNIVRKGILLNRILTEHAHRNKARETDSFKVRFSYGDNHAEVLFLDEGGLLTRYEDEDQIYEKFEMDEGAIQSFETIDEESYDGVAENAQYRRRDITTSFIESLENHVGETVTLHI